PINNGLLFDSTRFTCLRVRNPAPLEPPPVVRVPSDPLFHHFGHLRRKREDLLGRVIFVIPVNRRRYYKAVSTSGLSHNKSRYNGSLAAMGKYSGSLRRGSRASEKVHEYAACFCVLVGQKAQNIAVFQRLHRRYQRIPPRIRRQSHLAAILIQYLIQPGTGLRLSNRRYGKTGLHQSGRRPFPVAEMRCQHNGAMSSRHRFRQIVQIFNRYPPLKFLRCQCGNCIALQPASCRYCRTYAGQWRRLPARKRQGVPVTE
ncbi:MAG: hypothetical protein H6Q76_2096, partial [Firmicutes bacterium]|nr:hypothetical protein [Bacillota bacterium]